MKTKELLTKAPVAVQGGMAGAYPPDARIDSVMSTDVVTVGAEADVHEAYRILGTHAVRRLAVMDGGQVLGMLTVDDLVVRLATDLERLVHPLIGELVFGHHPAPLPVVP